MLARLAFVVGRRLIRWGMRLLGMSPTCCVIFMHEDWTAEALARWAAGAVRAAPDTPADVMVCTPVEAYAAFLAALAAERAVDADGEFAPVGLTPLPAPSPYDPPTAGELGL